MQGESRTIRRKKKFVSLKYLVVERFTIWTRSWTVNLCDATVWRGILEEMLEVQNS